MGKEARIRAARKAINSATKGKTPMAYLTYVPPPVRRGQTPIRNRTLRRAYLRSVAGTGSIRWLADRHLDAYALAALRLNKDKPPKQRVEPIRSTTTAAAVAWWSRVVAEFPAALQIARAGGRLTDAMLRVNPFEVAV